MFPSALSDLDGLVLQCRDGKARSYVAEAVTCIKVGAFRAAIVVTWVAVVHDLLAKLDQLSLGGDKKAQGKIDAFRRIVSAGAIKASLDFERTILEVARDEFELLGPLAHVDLARLREDRHRCAHPSMIDPDTDYQPAAELARCHLVNAVTHLLAHGAVQGKAALARLFSDLDQTYFPDSVDELVVHLEHGPLGRPRSTLVRNYVIVLLKEYFAEAPPPPTAFLDAVRARVARAERGHRIVRTLAAVVRMHPQIAVAALNEKLDGVVAQATEAVLWQLLVLAKNVTETWHALSRAQKNRVERYVRSIPVGELAIAMQAAWALPDLRPSALERFSQMPSDGWDALAKMREPPKDWIQLALEKLSKATSWGEANSPKEFLVACASLISEEQIKALLVAAKTNDQLRSSWGVKDTLAALTRSAHFGSERVKELVGEAGLAEAYESESWWPVVPQPQ